jgi:hypothetical protein
MIVGVDVGVDMGVPCPVERHVIQVPCAVIDLAMLCYATPCRGTPPHEISQE